MKKLINPIEVKLDSDGVIFNMNRHVYETFGLKISQMREEDMWARIEATPDFFETMPLMDDALILWDYFKEFNPTILTGCPRVGTKQAEIGKRRAWEREFGAHIPVITCFSRDKALHLKSPGELLIDDFAKNCKRWEAAGGASIRHRNAEKTIAEFEERFLK